MTWWTGVPEERRAEFVAELQHRLDADQVPYRVGKAHYRGGLVFRCQVKGRDRRARQARSEAFEHCSIHEQLLRLEMFGVQPVYPVVREALAFLAALILAKPPCERSNQSVPRELLEADRITATAPPVERHS